MKNTTYRFLGGHGALDYAKKINISLEVDSYFVTEHQYEKYKKKRDDEFLDTQSIALEEVNGKYHGTVGAVALDQEGNVAAATSTGGTENCKEGRIGDSSIIGAGCFADKQYSISATGDGEFIIKNVVANSIRCAAEYKNLGIQEACDYVLFNEEKNTQGDIGVIALDNKGNIGIAFNCERLHRGYKSEGEETVVKIYK